MDKWTKNKFARAIKEREFHKKRIRDSGCYIPLGTANPNVTSSGLKRYGSRESLPQFTNVDFKVSGNTNDIHHLIRTSKGNAHAGYLNFPTSLRTWQSNNAV